jgi:hypothetical protein
MGYSPEIWGRQGWHFIQMVALAYPENPTQEDKEEYSKFFESLKHVLPCPFCSMEYANNWEQHPINLDSRDKLFHWTVDMHNEVNKKNNKRVLNYDEAYGAISQNCQVNPKIEKKPNKEKDIEKYAIKLTKNQLLVFGSISLIILLMRLSKNK